MKRFLSTIALATAVSSLVIPLPGMAQDGCEFDISAGNDMAFNLKQMTVAQSCGEITVNLTNTSNLPANAMGHNWVLSQPAELQPIAMDGQSAGLDNDYIKPGDERVIAHSKIIGGGESTSVTFSIAELETGSEYVYFCSFPGHWAIMQGTLKVE